MTLSICASGLAGSSGSSSKTSRAAPASRPDRRRLHQGRLVDDRAARRVDEDRGRLHPGEVPGIDQVVRLLRQQDVERHDVGLAQQLLERHQLDAQGRGCIRRHVRITRQEAKAERPGPRRDQSRYAPEANQAERHGRQPADGARCRSRIFPRRPAARADEVLHVRKPADRGQDQGQRMVGHLVDEGVGHVGDEDAVARGRLDVDVVVTDGGTQHEARAPEPPEHAGVERQAARDHDLGRDRLGGQAPVRAVHRRPDDLETAAFHHRARLRPDDGPVRAGPHYVAASVPALPPPREIGLHVSSPVIRRR